MQISEKEFAVIREISNNHLPDQRAIANRAGISLGLTNLIIKRLIKKGYIKAKQLNKKKIQYLLTPKGFGEKANKSYTFTLKTIGMLRTIREQIQELIVAQNAIGIREFNFYGDNDELFEIICMAFKDLRLMNLSYSYQKDTLKGQGSLVLEAFSRENEKEATIDLIAYLSEKGMFYQ